MAAIIDSKTLEHVASLARLEISPDQEDKLLNDLENILGYVAQLTSIDTSSVVTKRPAMTELRPDEVIDGLTREQGLGGAPAMRDGFVVVRNVMGGEDE
ncbi:MAG: Asp-tRNA(Asn)/Glu-tRNA(Gln) amidotransferase subunit GatC [Candidatus Cryosericum sp.]|nr:Asp-tRNA(Asn)/Glu-tRNA(Gln) amidotransferase subunit GatC [bacterium]